MWTLVLYLYITSCKYPSSGRSKLSVRRIYRASRSIYSFGPLGLCPAEEMSFISIHQVAPATALPLVLLLLRALLFARCRCHEFFLPHA